jgi:ribA/ribD-fused uncharacterized protein
MFEDYHRLGGTGKHKPRPIIIRLLIRADWRKIWYAKKNLKGTKFILTEDLPEDYRRNRGIVMPVMVAAKQKNKQALFQGDKLKINGHLYGVHDLHHLPADINPEQGCIRETGDVICFFGRHTPLSNFHACSFKVDSCEFSSVEQYLQSSKAQMLGDNVIAQKIMATDDPVKQKSLGSNAKGNIAAWRDVAKQVVFRAVKAKFSQNDGLREYLRATESKTLGEASTDPDWGIGLFLRNPHCTNNATWKGSNWLGEILMKVRSELN